VVIQQLCKRRSIYVAFDERSMLTNGTFTSRFYSVIEVCEMGKDLYLYISLDKVGTAVPTRANLLLPFVLSVLLG
jgi:hypothetical protein